MKIRALVGKTLCALSAGLLSITAFAQESVNALTDEYGGDTAWRQAVRAAAQRVINPGDYVCEPTPFNAYITEQLLAIDPLSLQLLFGLGAINWPADYKVIFDSDVSDEYIGTFGQLTREQIKRHKDNQRFWDIPSDDILLMGMHGADIADDAKMLPLINLYKLFGILPPQLSAQYVVDTIQTVIEGGTVDLQPLFNAPVPLPAPVPGVPGRYQNPLFTLNAFAFTDSGFGELLGVGVIPDKIVMGEGLIDALFALGLGRNGPDYVHAHEFAHHVQFETPGAIHPPPQNPADAPERTRRTELMADAFGAYYSSHARGATFQAKNFADVMTAASSVGDCGFTSPGHHGTPNQRDAAAAFGGSITAAQQKKGHILSAAVMLELFDAELPALVAPDAP